MRRVRWRHATSAPGDCFVRPAEILYAWQGPSLLIVNPRGDCGPDQRLSGFYFREARYLGTLALEINGKQPWLCEAASIDPTALAFTYVHPEITVPGGGGTGQAGDEEGSMRTEFPSVRWTSACRMRSASPVST